MKDEIKEEKQEIIFQDSDIAINLNINKLEKELDEFHKNQKSKETIKIIQKLAPLYEQTNCLQKAAFLYIRISDTYGILRDMENSLIYTDKAEELFYQIDHSLGKIYCLRLKGYSLRLLSRYDEALENLLTANNLFEENYSNNRNDQIFMLNYSQCMEITGLVYQDIKQNENARFFIKKAMELYEEMNHPFGVAKSLNNLGITYIYTEPEKSIEYYKKAQKIAENQNWANLDVNFTNNIGDVYEEQNDLVNALKYYNLALQKALKINSNSIPLIYKHIANVYIKENKPELAEKNLKIALVSFEKNFRKNKIADCYNMMNQVYKLKENYKTALEFYEKYAELNNEIINKKVVDKLANLQDQYKKTSDELKETKQKYSLISDVLKRKNMDFIGKSTKIKQVIKQAMRAASYPNTNILITGESGTGKEIIAHTIHYASKRKENLFVPVNCCSIPASLVESEFFGYKKGAFTGAIKDKIGFFEEAHNGSLFLDEIADTPLALQAKLLRVLENRKIKKIGSNEEQDINFRIISATNKDLKELIRNSDFRADLLFRLNTIEINIPPLRERKADIEPLLRFFVNKLSLQMNKKAPKIDDLLIDKLVEYDFPGNIRELKNMVERGLIICDDDILSEKDFELTCQNLICEKPCAELMFTTLDEMEDFMILKTLKQTGDNQTKTAKILGLSYSTLLRKLKKLKR
ncbi:MAG: sigma 54-interacting transcriptional regulator [Candidatus Cloacimonetes bacterium]|nr:sigma 54-interacting transcriptional regulator [Candidatus Cloacimonadota bacterium]